MLKAKGLSFASSLIAPAILAPEFVYPPCRIDDLLLARIEGMANRTDFHVDVPTKGRTGLNGIATATGDGDGFVFGMNSRFHARLANCKLKF